jgi:AraC-like DNA-binding protein
MAAKILKVNKTSDYSRYHGLTDRHPLITVIDFSEISPIRHSLNKYGVYGVFVQEDNDLDLMYGCGKYDYKDGSLICVSPGQIGGKEENGERVSIGGWAMLFHPDLIRGTQLEKDITNYSFFDYSVNEALHMNEKEREIVVSIFKRIKSEIENPHDDLKNDILVSYISLLLKYCQRFYNRQFLTRKLSNNDILSKFDSFLKEYFTENRHTSSGLPTVSFCAEHLCMSVNYFSDLIKKMTGESAGRHIRQFIIRQIKNELASGLTVAEAAYKLGFEYPAHLSRMFRKETGITPTQYIQSRRE